MHKGTCLCGAVSFTVDAALVAATGCHCTMCRRHSGHYGAFAEALKAAVTIQDGGKLAWYQSSECVRRGFCSVCGSSLFFDPLFQDWTGIALGAIKGATDTKLERHIFVADKGDYYDIADGLPQNQQ